MVADYVVVDAGGEPHPGGADAMVYLDDVGAGGEVDIAQVDGE